MYPVPVGAGLPAKAACQPTIFSRMPPGLTVGAGLLAKTAGQSTLHFQPHPNISFPHARVGVLPGTVRVTFWALARCRKAPEVSHAVFRLSVGSGLNNLWLSLKLSDRV